MAVRAGSDRSVSEKTFSGVGNLIKLLPTGTVFLFQFLNPVLSNNGKCDNAVNKYLTAVLVAVCGFSCAFACFTDSYVGSDGSTRYGVATWRGIWPAAESESVELSEYKLRLGDFVHALLSVVVFAVVALLDSNTVGCFYPAFESAGRTLLMVLPPVIGVFSGGVFVLFPNRRHGIGYPSSPASS